MFTVIFILQCTLYILSMNALIFVMHRDQTNANRVEKSRMVLFTIILYSLITYNYNIRPLFNICDGRCSMHRLRSVLREQNRGFVLSENLPSTRLSEVTSDNRSWNVVFIKNPFRLLQGTAVDGYVNLSAPGCRIWTTFPTTTQSTGRAKAFFSPQGTIDTKRLICFLIFDRFQYFL